MAEDRSANRCSAAAARKRHDLIELCVGYGLIMLVIWTSRPLQRLLYYVAIIVLFAILWTSFEGWTAMGLRLTNLLRSLWVMGVALLMAGGAVLLAIRLHTLHVPDGPVLLLKTYTGYVVWSFAQQILLLDFFLLRLLRLLPGSKSAVMATAGIFALAHLPNPILTPLTLLWGLAACLLFLRYRNLYPLAIAHAIFGICIAVTVPGSVSHNMRVGLGYLHYRRYGGHQRSQIDHIVSTHAWVIAEAPTRRR
ncbi:MAG TPA: CPBP family intramembrane glutamic endopeptidase [Acidobacteriaceae bacterium]|nr:CPBP family intramembrane glutamic endopeptidase [Acidobacteriaceae bacterium]